MEEFKIKDPCLASQGRLQIEWASKHMLALTKIKKRFVEEKPLKNTTLAACLHVTKETGVLVQTLLAGGAKVVLCGSNPLSTQDDVAAALAEMNVNVFAWRGQTTSEYYWCFERALTFSPTLILDDGADFHNLLHNKGEENLSYIKGGTEETTTGVLRLRAMEEMNALRYPVIAVNDAYTKYLFDNRYGTGQSTLDGIVRATNILIAGKNFVVCGYGWCGKGIALRAQGMGGNIIVTETNPLRALEAAMNGFRVMPIDEAAAIGDIFVTATGNTSIIRKEHMLRMKNRAILANSGHFNVEIDSKDLQDLSKSKRKIRANLDEYTLEDGKRLYLLAEGRLVNLTSAEGHPSEVMDMSFADQALCVEYLVRNDRMAPKVIAVPKEIDETVAKLKLAAMKIEIDELTEEQMSYLKTWSVGTD
jgi:adenosylhomocysteinase